MLSEQSFLIENIINFILSIQQSVTRILFHSIQTKTDAKERKTSNFIKYSTM